MLKGWRQGKVRLCEPCAEARWGRLVLFGSFLAPGPLPEPANVKQCDVCGKRG